MKSLDSNIQSPALVANTAPTCRASQPEKKAHTIVKHKYYLSPIDDIKLNPHNPREHPDEQVAQLARSIEAFGFTLPLLIDENGVLIAGEGRLLAARVLELPEVPVLVIEHLTDQEKLLYLVADNQLTLNSNWDEQKLQAIVSQLERDLANLDLTGLRPQEIDRILADLAPEEGATDEDELPEVPSLVTTCPGDLWNLGGKHWVLAGDATDATSYERLLKGEPADMVFCDPPYNCAYRQKRRTGPARTIINDNLGTGFEEFLRSVCVQLLSVTRGALYICMSSAELHTLYKAFTEAGGHWSTFVIWNKERFTLGRSDMQRQFEPILYGWKEGQEHYWCGARNESDVWCVPKPKANRLHPTCKPVSLVERAIRNSSRRGDRVLDAFGGSGSTLIACEKSGRRGYLMELDLKYVDVIIRRWEAYSQQEATLEGDGRTFTAIAAERCRLAA
jgi:DNA modification methylase